MSQGHNELSARCIGDNYVSHISSVVPYLTFTQYLFISLRRYAYTQMAGKCIFIQSHSRYADVTYIAPNTCPCVCFALIATLFMAIYVMGACRMSRHLALLALNNQYDDYVSCICLPFQAGDIISKTIPRHGIKYKHTLSLH